MISTDEDMIQIFELARKAYEKYKLSRNFIQLEIDRKFSIYILFCMELDINMVYNFLYENITKILAILIEDSILLRNFIILIGTKLPKDILVSKVGLNLINIPNLKFDYNLYQFIYNVIILEDAVLLIKKSEIITKICFTMLDKLLILHKPFQDSEIQIVAKKLCIKATAYLIANDEDFTTSTENMELLQQTSLKEFNGNDYEMIEVMLSLFIIYDYLTHEKPITYTYHTIFHQFIKEYAYDPNTIVELLRSKDCGTLLLYSLLKYCKRFYTDYLSTQKNFEPKALKIATFLSRLNEILGEDSPNKPNIILPYNVEPLRKWLTKIQNLKKNL